MQIILSHAERDNNGFKINDIYFHTFRCLGTTTELLEFCIKAITDESDCYYYGETKEDDFSGDVMLSRYSMIFVKTSTDEAVFPATEFAKAVTLAIASDIDAWTIPGYNSSFPEAAAEVHSCNQGRYEKLENLLSELKLRNRL